MTDRRILGVWLLLGVAAARASAGTGEVLRFPQPRVVPRSGVLLTVDTRWVIGSGYRPVRVRVQPLVGGAAAADRYFAVTVRPHGWYTGSRSPAAAGVVHLPQGALFGEATIDVPQTAFWSRFEIDTFEDGDWLADLSTDGIVGSPLFYNEPLDAIPSILIVHSMAPSWTMPVRGPDYTGWINVGLEVTPEPMPIAGGMTVAPLLVPRVAVTRGTGMGSTLQFLPDIRTLVGRFPMHYYGGVVTPDRLDSSRPATDSEIMQLANDIPFLDILPPAALPDHWVSYGGVDLVILSLADLDRMAAEHPAQWEALRLWLSTGTTLCVSGMGGRYERLERLAELLDLAEVPGERADDPEPLLRGWQRPRPQDRKAIIPAVETAGSVRSYGRMTTVPAEKVSREEPPSEKRDTTSAWPPFVTRRAGQGMVVALAAENAFPGEAETWSWIFNSVAPPQWLWYQRHGLSFRSDNIEFWNFLIPDIGRAPVMSFLALITLFAVVIGPINYWLLQRQGRLYLLLVTVPVGALVVTAGLFVYAALADGLGVRVRIRSYTDLDQRQGRAVSWSRQTYYAGLAPSRGLVFPADAAVYAIDHHPVSGFGLEDSSRLTRWGEEQHLASGYFLSRTTSQLLVVEPRRTTAGLRFVEPADGGPLRVKNDLGIPMERLMVCDARGRFFRGTRLPAGAEIALEPAVPGEEGKVWKAALNANRPRYPERFDPDTLENITGIFGSPFATRYAEFPATFQTSMLELNLAAALGSDFQHLRPRTYVAIVPRPPLVSLGVDSATEVAGLHVVGGRW